MKLLFLTVSLVTAFASEPGDSGSFTEAQHFPNGPGDYSYVDEALQMMDGRLVVADEQNNPIYPKTGDMSMLLGRSRWCTSWDGQCRRGKFSCPHKYESPYGRPYCTSKNRRCCYPVQTTTAPAITTPEPTTPGTCLGGFFRTGNASFLLLRDAKRSFEDAQAKCVAENGFLAEPQDPLAVRISIVETCAQSPNYNGADDDYVILGARGNGSTYIWQHGNSVLSNTSPYWRPQHPGLLVQPRHCLMMLSSKWNLAVFPTQPYWNVGCDQEFYALCQLFQE